MPVSLFADVMVDTPDEQSVVTYVAQFLEHFPDLEAVCCFFSPAVRKRCISLRRRPPKPGLRPRRPRDQRSPSDRGLGALGAALPRFNFRGIHGGFQKASSHGPRSVEASMAGCFPAASVDGACLTFQGEVEGSHPSGTSPRSPEGGKTRRCSPVLRAGRLPDAFDVSWNVAAVYQSFTRV